MATYPEIAPILSGLGITKTLVNTALDSVPVPGDPAPLPNVTKSKATAVMNAYLGTNTPKSFRNISREVGLKLSQVKEIVKEIEAVKSDRAAKLEPVEVPVEVPVETALEK